MEPSYKISLLVVFLVIRHPVLSAEVLRNVALGNPVTLSTTLTGFSLNNPSSAVDGNMSQNTDTCGCCVSSLDEPNPWLTVDLKEQYMVQKVVVIGRSDNLKNYISRNLLHLQMFSGNHTSTVQLVSQAQIEMDNNTATARDLDQPFIRRITLKRPKPDNVRDQWFLTVCEIEIYVIECTSGTYGNNGVCKTCGYCSGGRSCDRVTGQCPEGCDPGYTGDTCTQECGHCTGGRSCDEVTGQCPGGCDPGYTGGTCTQGYPKNEAADEQGSHMATVAVSVSVCAVAAAVTVIVVVRLMRRKRMLISSRKESTYEVPVWHAHQNESAYSVLDNTHNLCTTDNTNK